MSTSEPTPERIVELESLVAHLEHEFDQLNSVVLRQQREIDNLKRTLSKLEARLDEQADGPEVRDPLQERPPHY